MSDPDPSLVTALATLEQVLTTRAAPGSEGEGPRPLPESWRDDPVKALIAMILAQPSHAGVEVALGWFYGRGLPDPAPATAEPGVMDVGAVVLDVLRRAAEVDGIEVVRRRFFEALGEGEGG